MSVAILIPVGPAHKTLAPRAIASAQKQTYPCNIVALEDGTGKGAGWARNQLAAQNDDDFFVFLDADDEIHPDFVLKSLRLFAQTGRYVYTDWQRHVNGTRDVEKVKTPDYSIYILHKHAFFHSITTLLPAAFWRAVGGFDESLPAWEDNDFYYQLAQAGLCGVRLPEVLFAYHASDGRRRQVGFQLRDRLWRLMQERYPMSKARSCCGGRVQPPALRSDGQQWPFKWDDDDAVEVEFIRGGALAFTGLATRIRYPRTRQGQRIWVHYADAEAEKNRPPTPYFRVLEGADRDIRENISRLQRKVKDELS